MSIRDKILEENLWDRINKEWPADEVGPHLINVICRQRGWAPLELEEQMTVRFGDEQFEIRRIA